MSFVELYRERILSEVVAKPKENISVGPHCQKKMNLYKRKQFLQVESNHYRLRTAYSQSKFRWPVDVQDPHQFSEND